jgi:hypothetical protein
MHTIFVVLLDISRRYSFGVSFHRTTFSLNSQVTARCFTFQIMVSLIVVIRSISYYHRHEYVDDNCKLQVTLRCLPRPVESTGLLQLRSLCNVSTEIEGKTSSCSPTNPASFINIYTQIIPMYLSTRKA